MTRIATCALEATYDIEQSLKRHLATIDEAADAGAELVVFPEISLQGYPAYANYRELADHLPDIYATAEPVPGGPSVDALAAKAVERGIHVIYGLTELGDARGVVYNTMVLTGPSGLIGTYRKVHLGLTEQIVWRQGHDWPTYQTPFGSIGMLICYDKAWPESCRELTLRGADLLVMSTAWSIPPEESTEENVTIDQYVLYERARAAENSRWFISSNFVGPLGDSSFFGISQIVDPRGQVVAATALGEPGLAIADVDVKGGIAQAYARMFGPRIVRDRRPETYRAQRGEIPLAIDG